MRKCLLSMLTLFLLATMGAVGQKKTTINLSKASSNSFQVVDNKSSGFRVNFSLSSILLTQENTKGGEYVRLEAENLIKTFNVGKPELPVISKLVSIPMGAEVTCKVISYDEEIINLNNKGVSQKIVPAQQSWSKTESKNDQQFVIDSITYKYDKFLGGDIVKVNNSGIMRNVRLGQLEIAPFKYNPAKNLLKVYSNLVIEVTFKKGKNTPVSKGYVSPFFSSINNYTINKSFNSKELIEGTPVKYVIVADKMFEETLEPFVTWKKQKGFDVEVAFTDLIGSNTTDIKKYLEDLYQNPAEGEQAPSFVLLVGDVDVIPSFNGAETYGQHVSDLYYCEYTGDYLPEVYYGRFSVNTNQELANIIEKTLEYEKYQMPSTDYLGNSLLIAGVDNTWAPTHGNGAVNYIKDNYLNAENGFNSIYYLYNDNSGGMSSNSTGAASSIIKQLTDGVGIVNYTAHGIEKGWQDPQFFTTDFENLNNTNKYGLYIGSCCLSNRFNYEEGDCFGEQIVNAEKKGAIGYIGATNNSLWDEDYWWGVGITSTITENTTYEESGLGAYDCLFHLNNEEKSNWYVTQSQIFVAGNLAVEASTSPNKRYYWEIYHLMGDPSLMNYLGVPEPITVSMNENDLYCGATSFQLITTPNAMVALNFKGERYDVAMADETGQVNLSFNELNELSEVQLVITAQNKQPLIKNIAIQQPNDAYVTVDEYTISDNLGNNNGVIEFGETLLLDVDFENIANQASAATATNIYAILKSDNPYIEIVKDSVAIEALNASDSIDIKNAYEIKVKNKIPDQTLVELFYEIRGNEANVQKNWISTSSFVVNAPQFKTIITDIDDSVYGNGDGILEPGETADINLLVRNIGHAPINQVKLSTIVAEGEEFLILNSDEIINLESIEVDTLKKVTLNVTASETTEHGTPVKLNISVLAGAESQYNYTKSEIIMIGELKEILISDGGTVEVSAGYFYDDGGPNEPYDIEKSYKITLKPTTPGFFTKVDFEEFEVIEYGNEGCIDALWIYDGPTTASPQLGMFCNANKPESISSAHPTGALTFVFKSTYYNMMANYPGWKAKISCVPPNEVFFTVKDKNGPVEKAYIEIFGYNLLTDANGKASALLGDARYYYNISKEGYKPIEEIVEVAGENVNLEVFIEKDVYTINFNLADENNNPVEADVTLEGISKITENGTVSFTGLPYTVGATYKVEASGFETVENTINISESQDVDLLMVKRNYEVTFVVSDNTNEFVQGALINVTDEFGTNINTLTNAEGRSIIKLSNGDYNYKLTSSSYNKEGSFLVESENFELKIQLGNTNIESFDALGYSVYPNPSNGKFIIDLGTNGNNAKVEIFDVTGISVYKAVQTNSKAEIDLRSYNSGVYFLNVQQNNIKTITSIIVN